MTNIAKPNEEQIKQQLERILGSEAFTRSARLTDFLSYIVEQEITGKGDLIKGYTIGVEVFGKPKDFDPDTDASIRVDAARLRKALKLYYYDEGVDDPVIIRIPKGKYRPKFITNIAEPDQVEPPKKSRTMGLMPIVFALLFIIGLLMLNPSIQSGIHDVFHLHTVKPVKKLKPIIAVIPFRIVGDEDTHEFGKNLSYKIISKLSKFNTLKALRSSSVLERDSQYLSSSDIGKELHAHYVLEGMIRREISSIKIQLRLLDIEKTTYVWSYNQTHDIPFNKITDVQDDVSSFLAGQLASPYGIIQNIEQERLHSTSDEDAISYLCILDYYGYSNNKTPAKHLKVRNCLEELVQREPDNSDAWAYLSWMYGNELRYNHNPVGNDEEIRAKSLDAAKKAVRIAPNNHTAHQYMANAALFNHDEAATRSHTKRSLELNPYDTETMADAAWNYGQLGEWEKSAPLAMRAIEVNPGHPRWYHGILFAQYYQAGDYKNALSHALESYQPGVLNSMIAVCVSYYGINQVKSARKIANDIAKKYPSFLQNPRQTFMVWNFREQFIDKMLIGLQACGVPIDTTKVPAAPQQ